MALSYKDIYCPCDVCKQTLTLRHSVRTELSHCLTMSLLLASVNRMKSNWPPTHCQMLHLSLMLMVPWVYRLTETELYLGHTKSCSGLTPESWSGGQCRLFCIYPSIYLFIFLVFFNGLWKAFASLSLSTTPFNLI